MGHRFIDGPDFGRCAQCALTKEEHDRPPSAVDWQQRISRALGVRPGHLTYSLDEAVAKIEELRGVK